MKYINHILSSRNGIDWSMTKLIGVVAAAAMVYKFVTTAIPDYSGFGMAITGIITALAIKYAVDEPEKKG